MEVSRPHTRSAGVRFLRRCLRTMAAPLPGTFAPKLSIVAGGAPLTCLLAGAGMRKVPASGGMANLFEPEEPDTDLHEVRMPLPLPYRLWPTVMLSPSASKTWLRPEPSNP